MGRSKNPLPKRKIPSGEDITNDAAETGERPAREEQEVVHESTTQHHVPIGPNRLVEINLPSNRQRRSKRKRQRVTIDAHDTDDTEIQDLPTMPSDEPPEVTILVPSLQASSTSCNSSSSSSSGSPTVLQIRTRQSQPSPSSSIPVVEEKYILRQERLHDVTIQVVSEDDDSNFSMGQQQQQRYTTIHAMMRLSITTQQGVTALLEHVWGDGRCTMDVVGQAVAVDKTLRVVLSKSQNCDACLLSVQLTPKAFDIASSSSSSPNALSPGQSKKTRKKGIQLLQQAIGALYPNTLLSQVVDMTKKKQEQLQQQAISAKQIYPLIDNVQLSNYEQHNNNNVNSSNTQKPMAHIFGLVPKLRPYQEAAVQWMIQRERGMATMNDAMNDEWELAWVTLEQRQGRKSTNSENNESEIVVSSLMSRRMKQQQQNTTTSERIIYYCPFTGWLTTSYEKAKEATSATCSNLNDDDGIVKGGICADSMGLGKTVEVIACILANPFVTLTSKQSSMTITTATNPTFNRTFLNKTDGCRGKNSSSCNRDIVVPTPPGTVPAKRPKGFDSEGDKGVSSSTSANPDVTKAATRSLPPTMMTLSNDEQIFDQELDSDEELSTQSAKDSTFATSAPKASPNTLLMNQNPYDSACICGKEQWFDNCLSFVMCESCHEPMHGICAGFTCIEELLRETSVKDNDDDDGNCHRWCRPDRCPSCIFSNTGLIQSRATLIVTPPAILDQWEREIKRHTCLKPKSEHHEAATNIGAAPRDNSHSLKVVVYPGIRRMFQGKFMTVNEATGRPACHLVHPTVLADADVVLMTFDALMGDLGHSDENPYLEDGSGTSRLRRRKRYRVVPSPLTGIQWWRVCLDEAQRVETPTATSARMALKLETEHRWCVSGTPIGRGKLEDLYGLMLFLRLRPFSSKAWFQKCFQPSQEGTMERVKHLLQNIMWRSTKASPSVRAQMGVPAQVEKKIMLRFSSIERHFYERQLEETILAASDVFDNAALKRKSPKVDNLSQHLHRLRAACCHPQVGATGIGRAIVKRTSGADTSTAASGVLTMDQILDRLIDDAKLKCEETQRLAVLHTNAMAALFRLKVEAKARGAFFVPDSDEALLSKSCDLYKESLEIAERNATPSEAIGEAMLTGCQGFLTPRKIIRDGKSDLKWSMRLDDETLVARELWARYDFEGPSKKICQIGVQSLKAIPEEWMDDGMNILYPKDCTFQVAHAALAGEFVDVFSISLEFGIHEEVTIFNGFRSIRSKSCRLVVKNYHEHRKCTLPAGVASTTFFVGLSVALYEPDVASDSLQRLHVLHNLSLSLGSLEQAQIAGNPNSTDYDSSIVKVHTEEMLQECEKIESLYLDGARAVHAKIKGELFHEGKKRNDAEQELANICAKATGRKIASLWQDMWWDDVLSNCYLNGTFDERTQLCERVKNDIHVFMLRQVGVAYKKENPGRNIPDFSDVNGLQTGLGFRLADCTDRAGKDTYHECMTRLNELSAYPSDAEQVENSHCYKCHADWNQTGPECSHCKLETFMLSVKPDLLILSVLESIRKWLKDTKSSSTMGRVRADSRVDERAEKFFEVVKACEKEWQRAQKTWRIHMDLLNDIDEVNQCKRSMRLAGDDEDMANLTDDELNAIVVPVDIPTRVMDHSAKQAMSLGTLRRNLQTLRYLKNQNKELQRGKESVEGQDEEATSCMICLSSMRAERAVLTCGHSFHHGCIKPLFGGRKAGTATMTCPLRCTTKTKLQDIMIASNRRQDDGSQRTRNIQGSWGTKVTRLICELMNVSDMGEKSLVFSQWEDMLTIVEQALIVNNVEYVRVRSTKKIGEAIKRFRSNECTAMLLNVKSGAEGLTLVEATHVFMVEPILNCGLDSQAIARIDRIGQTRTTTIHRFLVEDTIEIKIDKLRTERQEDHQVEDSINEARRKHEVEGGGIDGGFSQAELQDLLR